MNNTDRNSLLKNLIDIFNKNNLNDLEFKDGDFEVKLKKSIHSNRVENLVPQHIQQTTVPQGNVPNNNQVNNINENTTTKAVDYSTNVGAVKSPTVGIVYTRPNPNEETFIKVGDVVKEGDTLFLLEVMKVYNPIKAHKSGVIKEILVKENSIVEYNEVLAIIE